MESLDNGLASYGSGLGVATAHFCHLISPRVHADKI